MSFEDMNRVIEKRIYKAKLRAIADQLRAIAVPDGPESDVVRATLANMAKAIADLGS